MSEHIEDILKSAREEIREVECTTNARARSIRTACYQYRRIAKDDYSQVSMKISGSKLILGPKDKLEHYWTNLKGL